MISNDIASLPEVLRLEVKDASVTLKSPEIETYSASRGCVQSTG